MFLRGRLIVSNEHPRFSIQVSPAISYSSCAGNYSLSSTEHVVNGPSNLLFISVYVHVCVTESEQTHTAGQYPHRLDDALLMKMDDVPHGIKWLSYKAMGT